MLKKLTIIFAILFFVMGAEAQTKKILSPVKLKINEPVTPTPQRFNPPYSTAAQNYVAVDTMPNSFGPASSSITPLAYDPDANTLAIVYRGNTTFSLGSGHIWYSISTDMGVSWNRISGVNTGANQREARYPNMAISNPSNGNISATTAVFTWAELNPDAFEWIGYGAAQPVGSSVVFADIYRDHPGVDYGWASSTYLWTDDTTSWIFWTADWFTPQGVENDNVPLWKTDDFISLDFLEPAQWSDSTNVTGGGRIPLGGASFNGVQYFGNMATFNDNYGPQDIMGGWTVGYSKSTDQGATWSSWNVPDWRTIPALSRFDVFFDTEKGDDFISYGGDINVDKNGFVHLLLGMTDTTTDFDHGVNAMVELFETASGWDGKIIYEGIPNSAYSQTFDSPALLQNDGVGDQMGFNGYLATNKAHDFFAAQWVMPANPADTVQDVFISYRALDGEWSQPLNLTETPGMNENGSHLAPFVAQNGNVYTAFSMYYYEAGNTTSDYVTTVPAVIYVAPVELTVTVGISDDINNVNSFELSQNYPNPFNPSTLIKYSLSERSHVSLKVFDILGREVAVLVNSVQNAGSHEITFDASSAGGGLASGLYIYTINSGSFTSSKKMMLLK